MVNNSPEGRIYLLGTPEVFISAFEPLVASRALGKIIALGWHLEAQEMRTDGKEQGILYLAYARTPRSEKSFIRTHKEKARSIGRVLEPEEITGFESYEEAHKSIVGL